MQNTDFTPALELPTFTRGYDLAIRPLAREAVWRGELLRQIALRDRETMVDIGCGTGTFAIMMKQAAPGARIIGFNPDPAVLEIAAKKAQAAGPEVEWRQGFARDVADIRVSWTRRSRASYFIRCRFPANRRAWWRCSPAFARAARSTSDYARHRSVVMRLSFRLTVQSLDGLADTQLNADGALERILSDRAGVVVGARRVVPTATGAISLFQAARHRTDLRDVRGRS